MLVRMTPPGRVSSGHSNMASGQGWPFFFFKDFEMENRILWRPPKTRVQNSQMERFRRQVASSHGMKVGDYLELHQWSVQNPQQFWRELLDFFPVIASGDPTPCDGPLSFTSYPWFSGLKLNFAQNLLARGEDNSVAITSLHESGAKRELTYRELREQVARLQGQLAPSIAPGDVVACYMPNTYETVVVMLATAGLGGIFTSTSCDFGVQGVVDRFGQVAPKVLIAATGYTYNGKFFDLGDQINQITERISSIEQVIAVDFLERGQSVPGAVDFSGVVEQGVHELQFVPRDFCDPLYIMYSSGTTGKPKCIVHSVGGTLLQHLKELGLHTDLTADKKIMYFTTCGWMMWNWLVSSLFFGAQVVLYEGAPHHPSLGDFIRLVDREGIHIFGTSPKLLRALEEKLGVDLAADFTSLETILSTGAPLLPEQFDYVYSAFKSDLLLGSICGGTDLIGCFMLGNPTLPVRRGEIQCLGLGMDVAAFDHGGKPLVGREGELVCRTPFISQPVGFWGDADNSKFSRAYFERFAGVWHHGDFITLTEHQGVVVHGRSDATLNPGGVRIGTAEIYRQTEGLAYIEDSVCIGRQCGGDVQVVLFVQIKGGEELTPDRVDEIKGRIRKNTTPRHVPQEIHPVSGIPYTRSGKKMELLVAQLVAGGEIKNLEAVANPQSLEQYRKFS